MAALKRSLTIDSLRGLCLLMMMFDHLLLTPFNSWQTLYQHSYGPLGFFSAAEMFFFIAGLVIGFILVGKPHLVLTARIKKIYLANLLAILFFGLLLKLFPYFFSAWNEAGKFAGFIDSWWETLFLSGVLLHLPYFFDVLPLYCLFFFFVPVIARLLQQQKLARLLSVSLLSWLFGQLSPASRFEAFIDPFFTHQKLPWFDPFSWQLLFVIGIVVGYAYQSNTYSRFFKPSRMALWFVGLFLATCFILRHIYTDELFFLTPFIDVKTLGPLRIVNFFAAAYFCFAILKGKKWFEVPSLAYLGRSSLVVFTYHAFLIYFLDVFEMSIKGMPLVSQIAIFLLALLSLWLPAVVLGEMVGGKGTPSLSSHA